MKSSCFTVSHILDAVDESSHADEKHSATNAKDLRYVSPRRANSDNVKVDIVLQEAELWRKFHSLVNEMIVTKNGRSVQTLTVKSIQPVLYTFWKYLFHCEFCHRTNKLPTNNGPYCNDQNLTSSG